MNKFSADKVLFGFFAAILIAGFVYCASQIACGIWYGVMPGLANQPDVIWEESKFFFILNGLHLFFYFCVSFVTGLACLDVCLERRSPVALTKLVLFLFSLTDLLNTKKRRRRNRKRRRK